MATETDMRLRSWLDANQRDREQMCRAVLALNPHFTDVRPRHPNGGPDGGRDIEARFDNDLVAYAAVGFHNGANDSEEQKKRLSAKFASDLKSALGANPELKVFVFMTNLHFTMGEQAEMKEDARKVGVEHCEIIDRERLRIELDSPAGFFVRFQHLGIPLSEAEQASFLARYGDRIQEVVSTGFQRIDRTLSRILFLQESWGVLDGIHVRFRLKETYPASTIGHFRAFVCLYLHAVKHDILGICFGSSDKWGRFSNDSSVQMDKKAGIGLGIGTGQWEQHLNVSRAEEAREAVLANEFGDDPAKVPPLICVGTGSSVGIDPVSAIGVDYSHDRGLVRISPRLELRDLDESRFVAVLNRGLAEKVQSIEVYWLLSARDLD